MGFMLLLILEINNVLLKEIFNHSNITCKKLRQILTESNYDYKYKDVKFTIELKFNVSGYLIQVKN